MALKEIDHPEVKVELTWAKIDAELAELGLMPETEADIGGLVEELVQLFKIIEDGHYVFGKIDQTESTDYHESLEVKPTTVTLRLGIRNLDKQTNPINYRNHEGQRQAYRLKVNVPNADIDLGFSFDLNYDINNVWIGGSGKFGRANAIDFKWFAHDFNTAKLIDNQQALRILVCSQQALKAIEAVAGTTQ